MEFEDDSINFRPNLLACAFDNLYLGALCIDLEQRNPIRPAQLHRFVQRNCLDLFGVLTDVNELVCEDRSLGGVACPVKLDAIGVIGKGHRMDGNGFLQVVCFPVQQ